MKLLIDDTVKRYGLNANETCVYAAILKCTKAGRGWFANYRDLAAALPFVISYKTVGRAVDTLLNLGLIEEMDNALFANLKSKISNGQIVPTNGQNVHTNGQNVPTPYNPLIINNMNEKEIATCASTRDTRIPDQPLYFEIRALFDNKHGLHLVGDGLRAEAAWKKASPIKRRKLHADVMSGAWDKSKLEWLVADYPEPTPDFLTGEQQDDCNARGIKLVQVRVDGKYRICTLETEKTFNLEHVCNWNF